MSAALDEEQDQDTSPPKDAVFRLASVKRFGLRKIHRCLQKNCGGKSKFSQRIVRHYWDKHNVKRVADVHREERMVDRFIW